ncbi:flavin-binding monooxygenase protein [Rutstroemia sp. NJR-2017a WRK4]|nr:flavin-binding monooxygenase protein [Rutstroemia sp. NJR-2017a WRK4]
MANMEHFDVVVVGAGWYGLAAAKTQLEVHPDVKMVILTDNTTIGGTWAKDRLYPGLKTNNLYGALEFSDFPMWTEVYRVQPREYIPGTTVYKYLTDYAKHFNIYDKVRYETRVLSAKHVDAGGWILTVSKEVQGNGSEASTIFASKLIVATGHTAEEFVPNLPGREKFSAPFFHMKYLPKMQDTFKTAKSVCVFGGAKSAYDAAYTYASRGIHVDWVIRESGHGPGWMSNSFVSPFKLWVERLTKVRFLTFMSPCIWGDNDGFGTIRNWFCKSTIGKFISSRFWRILQADIVTDVNWDAHPETAKLRPWSDVKYTGTMLSILNYETDILELVRDGTISVHIGDIKNMAGNKLSLSNGEVITTDVFIAATGWRHTSSIKLLPGDADTELPEPIGSSEPSSYTTKADNEIFSKFPVLSQRPEPRVLGIVKPEGKSNEQRDPYRLYRFMIPPVFANSRDIAYVGALTSVSVPDIAQTQALWVTAFFDHKIPIPSDITYQTVLHSRFGKWRYPYGFGARYPDFLFDILPYIDMLLKDLNLKTHRKSNIFWELFEPYRLRDYKGLVDEWKESIKEVEAEGEPIQDRSHGSTEGAESSSNSSKSAKMVLIPTDTKTPLPNHNRATTPDSTIPDHDHPPPYTPFDSPLPTPQFPPSSSSTPKIPTSKAVSSSGAISLLGPLRILESVSGSSSITLSQHVTIEGPLKSSSKIVLADDVHVQGGIKGSSSILLDGGEGKGAVRVGEGVRASGSVEFRGDVWVKGDVSASGKVLLEGVGGVVRVGGKVNSSSAVTVKGDVQLGDVDCSGKIVVEGGGKECLVVDGDVSCKSGAVIDRDVQVCKNFSAKGNVSINGRLLVKGDLTVWGNVKIQQGCELIVNGMRTVHGKLEQL